MKEIELKVLGINKHALEAQLKKLGAKRIGRVLVQYKKFDTKSGAIGKRGGLLRLRRLGNVIELTHKARMQKESGFKVQEETQTTVQSFENMEKLLRILGLKPVCYIEKYRTSYLLAGAHLEIDEHPGVPAYLEIEGNPQTIRHVLKLLNFSMKDTSAASAHEILRNHGKSTTLLTFKKHGPKK